MVKRHQIPEPRQKGVRWFTLILVLVCQFMIHAWVRTESTQAMLRISQTQAKVQKTISYRKALWLERDRLKSEVRITRIARTRLGLTSEVSGQTIYLSKDQLSGEHF